MKKKFLIFFLNVLFFLPLITSGAGLVPCNGIDKPCTLCDFFVLIQNVINFILFDIVPPLAILIIAIGGFLFVFSYVNPIEGGANMIARAKKLFVSLVIGLLLIYGAWLIINTFFLIIGVESWTNLEQGWFKINCASQ